jgi:hypothetical protein
MTFKVVLGNCTQLIDKPNFSQNYLVTGYAQVKIERLEWFLFLLKYGV